MSTRKLILTALICGLAIMVAGGTKLFQMATEEATPVVYSLGTSKTLSDMTVSVTKVEKTVSANLVTVTMVGVEGAAPTEGWVVMADGKTFNPEISESTCEPISKVVTQTCVVAFPPSIGNVKFVAYGRADAQSQWAP